MNKLKNINFKFFFISILINILIIPFFELVHIIVYKMQGYEVVFSFTNAYPMNEVKTIFGAITGVGVNLLFACIFAVLFIEHKSLYIYAAVVANTLMARIIFYIFAIFGAGSLNDEIYIAGIYGISPVIVYFIGLIVMCTILGMSTRRLFINFGKKYSLQIIALSVIACVIAIYIVR